MILTLLMVVWNWVIASIHINLPWITGNPSEWSTSPVATVLKMDTNWVKFGFSFFQNILNHMAPSNWTASSSTPTFLVMLWDLYTGLHPHILHFKPEKGDCCVHRNFITASTYRVDKPCKVKLYTEFRLWNLKYFQSVSLLWVFRCGQSHESKYRCELLHYFFFLIVQ